MLLIHTIINFFNPRPKTEMLKCNKSINFQAEFFNAEITDKYENENVCARLQVYCLFATEKCEHS